jgi:hypothetical protein
VISKIFNNFARVNGINSKRIMSVKEQNGKGVKSFIIANPIYDTVFKKLMENKLIVNFFLSTILERQVTDVTVLPQEFTIKGTEKKDSKEIPYSILRLDFMATVQTADGKPEKVLIEVQKAWDKDDMIRFRKYLGEQYAKKETVNGRETALPITTIYILGFKLDGIESPCVRVGRSYMDMINGETIRTKSDFIEMLTHDSYII